jgi:hypothetical protein
VTNLTDALSPPLTHHKRSNFGGWVGSGTAPGRGGGGDSFFDFSFTTTAAAPISRIRSFRITAICLRHGSIKEKSGRGNR